MKSTAFLSLSAVVASIASVSGQSCPHYNVKVFKDTGSHAGGIRHTVEKFRGALGGINNMNSAGQKTGQRAINWDADIVPFDMPFDFFDKTVTRGAVFSAKGHKFAVSNPASTDPAAPDDRFDSLIGKRIARQLRRFSQKRLFSPVKDNKVTVTFNVPQKHRSATVTGFGAVFTDVDRKHQTKMTFRDSAGCVIARVNVPTKGKGLSFVGITVKEKHGQKLKPVIRKASITLGDKSLAEAKHNQHSGDFVALDDLIYGEPQRVHM